jgi:hypothetical protein
MPTSTNHRESQPDRRPQQNQARPKTRDPGRRIIFSGIHNIRGISRFTPCAGARSCLRVVRGILLGDRAVFDLFRRELGSLASLVINRPSTQLSVVKLCSPIRPS